MVTAGVYLIARTHVLFMLAPVVLGAVAVIGAATLLLAGFSALTQWDIKRVLAYSTISQIGYMFLALGVGAWSAAMFHFMTHAFFKALLFLGAGAVILCMHHEHNMFKMGGLRRQLPLTFWTFLIGAASLAALPLLTAGFYSKDLILLRAFTSEAGSPWLWLAGLVGALITSIYTFRMVFVTFYGESRGHVEKRPGSLILIPLLILAALSIVGGFVETPATLGGVSLFSNFMASVLPTPEEAHATLQTELILQGVTAAVSLAGVAIAYVLYGRRTKDEGRSSSLVVRPSSLSGALHRLWFAGWGFDWLYERLFVRPYVWLAQGNKEDNVDLIPLAIARLNAAFHRLLSHTQTGKVRNYALGIALGAVLTIAIVVWL
jgi:NADH-quinone oxidoreductase subunit L